MIARWTNRGAAVGDDRGVPFSAMAQHPAIPVKGLDGSWANVKELVGSDLANTMQQVENQR